MLTLSAIYNLYLHSQSCELNYVGENERVSQSSASAQCVSMCSTWQIDSILSAMWICALGQAAGQWHRPYSRISDVDTRASAQSASHLPSDDIHRFILWGTCPRILLFKLPLVCFKILIQIQILARWRECIKTFHMLGFFFLNSCGIESTSFWL